MEHSSTNLLLQESPFTVLQPQAFMLLHTYTTSLLPLPTFQGLPSPVVQNSPDPSRHKLLHPLQHLLTPSCVSYLVLFMMCTQSCPVLCNPMDYSPSDSSVHGTLQARILEGVAISSSRGSAWPRGWTYIVAALFKTELHMAETLLLNLFPLLQNWHRHSWTNVVKLGLGEP